MFEGEHGYRCEKCGWYCWLKEQADLRTNVEQHQQECPKPIIVQERDGGDRMVRKLTRALNKDG